MKSKVFEAQFLNIDDTVGAAFDILLSQIDNEHFTLEIIAAKDTKKVIVNCETFILFVAPALQSCRYKVLLLCFKQVVIEYALCDISKYLSYPLKLITNESVLIWIDFCDD